MDSKRLILHCVYPNGFADLRTEDGEGGYIVPTSFLDDAVLEKLASQPDRVPDIAHEEDDDL